MAGTVTDMPQHGSGSAFCQVGVIGERSGDGDQRSKICARCLTPVTSCRRVTCSAKMSIHRRSRATNRRSRVTNRSPQVCLRSKKATDRPNKATSWHARATNRRLRGTNRPLRATNRRLRATLRLSRAALRLSRAALRRPLQTNRLSRPSPSPARLTYRRSAIDPPFEPRPPACITAPLHCQ